jgi:hypothetical protein
MPIHSHTEGTKRIALHLMAGPEAAAASESVKMSIDWL